MTLTRQLNPEQCRACACRVDDLLVEFKLSGMNEESVQPRLAWLGAFQAGAT